MELVEGALESLDTPFCEYIDFKVIYGFPADIRPIPGHMAHESNLAGKRPDTQAKGLEGLLLPKNTSRCNMVPIFGLLAPLLLKKHPFFTIFEISKFSSNFLGARNFYQVRNFYGI